MQEFSNGIDYEANVRAFHEKYGHFISTPTGKPSFDIPEEVIDLRIALIREEYGELLEAIKEKDIFETADGIADLIYVLVGTAISLGIPINRIFNEVHNSNMTKRLRDPNSPIGSKYGTKTPKGADYIAPDIPGILFFPYQTTKLEEKNWNNATYNSDKTLKVREK